MTILNLHAATMTSFPHVVIQITRISAESDYITTCLLAINTWMSDNFLNSHSENFLNSHSSKLISSKQLKLLKVK